jgi:hypothetical protein
MLFDDVDRELDCCNASFQLCGVVGLDVGQEAIDRLGVVDVEDAEAGFGPRRAVVAACSVEEDVDVVGGGVL